MTKRSREELLEKVVNIFSEQSEVREITLFGSNADFTVDRYSDIDIRVHSNDLLSTQKKYLQLLASISPIFETLIIQSDSENLAQMIMLREYSPYHKIDFGICSGDCVFTPSRSIYRKEKTTLSDSKLQILPITADVKFNLDYLLFRAPRIMKCFFRKDKRGYKKWQETVDLLLVLLFEKYDRYKMVSHNIDFSSRKIKNLHGRLNAEDKDVFNRILPYPGELYLVDSFLAALKLTIAISKEKAAHFKIGLNEEFVTVIENFCKEECDKVNEEKQLRDYWTIPLDKIELLF